MATGNDEAEVYEELKGFLMSERVDVRKAATEAVLQIRFDEEHRERFLLHNDGLLLKALVRNASYDEHVSSSGSQEDSAAIPVNALHALVYFSSHGSTAHQCTEMLLESNMIARLLEISLSNNPSSASPALKEAWNSKINYAMALMANLTRLEKGTIDLVGRTLPEKAVTASELKNTGALRVKATMDLLLDRYLNPAFVQNWPDKNDDHNKNKNDNEDETVWTVDKLESKGYDPYQHFAAVLMNATQVDQGRNFLMQLHYTTEHEDGTSYLQAILPQLRSANPVRRRGTAGTIRNICIDKDSSWWLLNVVQISKDIMYPLAGPEELDVDEKRGLHPDVWLEGPDKKREPDQTTRIYLVESLLTLCTAGRKGRERLRNDRVDVILKWAGMVEESEQVSECITECIQYLHRDDEAATETSEDGGTPEDLEDTSYKPSSTASEQIRGDHDDGADYDNVD